MSCQSSKPGHAILLRSNKVVEDYLEARALGIETRPVLLGPVSFVLLGKPTDASVHSPTGSALDSASLQGAFTRLSQAGAEWVQLDEPYLCSISISTPRICIAKRTADISNTASLPKFLLATYFGALGRQSEFALELGTAGLHLDLVRAPEQLDALLSKEASPTRGSRSGWSMAAMSGAQI